MSGSQLPGESFLEYRARVMDPISPTFCGAKWYNATIWLNAGRTVSCHHPSAHVIPIESIKKNPSALHNTDVKKAARQDMLNGVKTSECKYCWDVEGLEQNLVSDRIFKTNIYTQADITAATLSATNDVNPRSLEISFDSTCNFACAYCSPTFSTTWQKMVRKHGPFQNIKDGDIFQYQTTDGLWPVVDTTKQENPFIKAFWEWWPSLSQDLEQLRITGGEPLMSDDVWKIIDLLADNHPNIHLAINTNLGAKPALIKKFIKAAEKLGSKLSIYTSAESTGPLTEFIRNGMDWEYWRSNVTQLLTVPRLGSMNIMTTVNALSFEDTPAFCQWVISVKRTHPYAADKFHASFNILKNPHFLELTVLPIELRNSVADRLDALLADKSWKPFERDSLARLIAYARSAPSKEELKDDLRNFVTQYAERTGKSYNAIKQSTRKFLEL